MRASRGPGVVAGWLKDRPFDLTFLVGITALACAMGLAARGSQARFLALLAVHSWLFGFDHVIATFTRLAWLPEDRRRHRPLLYALPLFFAGTLAVGTGLGIIVLNSTYFLWQWFHMTRQSWGIAQHYRRAAGGMAWDPPWLSELTLWSFPVAGLLRRCHQQPGRFLFMDLWLPPVPAALYHGAVVVAAALALLFVVTRLRALRRGELPLGHTLFLSTHALVFGLGYLVIDDLHGGWLLTNVWHNVQYLAYVWLQNRRRFEGGPRAEAPWLSWLCQPGAARAAAYFAACLCLSTPLFAGLFALGDRLDEWLLGRVLSLSLGAALAINFHHYLVDGLIWRRPRAA